MKLPSRKPTHLDSEDEQKWNHTDEPSSGGRCCACPKTDNQLKKEQEEMEYRKTFENYLHNEVFDSRYTRLRPGMSDYNAGTLAAAGFIKGSRSFAFFQSYLKFVT